MHSIFKTICSYEKCITHSPLESSILQPSKGQSGHFVFVNVLVISHIYALLIYALLSNLALHTFLLDF